MSVAIAAGYNDFYLRHADEDKIQEIFGCDASFSRGFLAKIFSRWRAEELPPAAEPASAQDYHEAIAHFRKHESINGGKIVHGAQSEYINDIFFSKNVNMQHAVLSRKLRGLRSGESKGRSQMLSDSICREVITPALNLFRAKGQTKWTRMVKLLMRQLLRIQEGVEAPAGILQLIQRPSQPSAHQVHESMIVDGEDDDSNSDSSSDTTVDGAEEEEQGNLDAEEEETGVDLQTVQLLRHVSASKVSGKKLRFQEFPTNRTFKKYKMKYGWAERKLEVLAAHRQSGSSGPAIQKNYEELGRQYVEHDIRHPDQIMVTDEIHWQKSWENALALISCIVASSDKRSQSGGPGKVSDGVTATPISSIIGTLYCVQVVLKDSQRNISDAEVIDIMVRSGFPKETIIVHRTTTGYQTAQSFKDLFAFLIVRLHSVEKTQITGDASSIPLKRKYLAIADGSSTHPFHCLQFCLMLAIVGIFMHQQESNSTHVANLYDRFVFLMTKLYAAKEVMMAILVAFNPPIQTDEMATLWLENVVSELKATIDPANCPQADRLITDPLVLAKLNSIVTFKDRPFDTLKLLSCIAPALRKGLQVKYHISSAIKVGLLPEGFKLVANYDWEQNIVRWRGPWVANVLKQDCVVGADIREREAASARANRNQQIQQTLQAFGMSTVQVPAAVQVQDLVDPVAFDVLVQASFAGKSPEETQQLKCILGIWEQTKKEVAAAAKRAKSRAAIGAVNSLNLEQVQEEALRAQTLQLEQDLTSLQTFIGKCGKKSEESLKQYSLAVARGRKCETLLPSPFSQSSKRCIEMLLSNVTNGDELWNAAIQEVTKIRRMDLASNADAVSMRNEFEERWSGFEESRYAIDVDSGIIAAANLAGSWVGEQNERGDEMQDLFRQ